MVKIKYPALYTDNLGCEQGEVCFFEEGIELRIRNSIFRNDDFNFDFYSNDYEKIKSLFYLKDNELIEYFADIKMKLVLNYNGIECVKEFLLRIERNKNYYNNSLSIELENKLYMVDGYDLQELLNKMKKKLPREYTLTTDFSCIFGAYYIKKEKKLSCFQDCDKEVDGISNKESYLYLFSNENKKKLDELQRIPIRYIYKEYCSS